MSLYDGHEGLGRYADQQVLYQWNKYEQLASLPHSAFLGQCDPRANGDEWMIVRAAASSPPQQGRFVAGQSLIGRDFSVARNYKSGDGVIVLQETGVTPAMLEDFYAEGVIFQGVNNLGGTGLTNRVMGHGSLPALGNGVTGEIEVVLEYPWQSDFDAGTVFSLQASKWGGVNIASDGGIACIGWSPISPTGGYYHWIKKCGDIRVLATANIALGEAVAVEDNGTAKPATANDQQVAVANESFAATQWGSVTLTLGL